MSKLGEVFANDPNQENNIFELINQLNESNLNSNSDSTSSSSCSESYSKCIEPIKQSNESKEQTIQQHQQQHQQQQQQQQKSKIPRFGNLVNKPNQIKTSLESNSNYSIISTESQFLNNNKNGLYKKRGVSLSNSNSLKSRAMSQNETSSENLSILGSSSSNSNQNKRYIIRHKPRESKVKIFSQKMEIKNVKSKIGSLDNANYVPGGGNVQVVNIENHNLNWEAKPKINSLEKAKNYQASGGNIKIKNYQVKWEAKSKINSLEKASYKPAGGNIKIESYKLDFKEKAKPKTDTGLIVIEDLSLNSSVHSFNGSN